MCYFLTRVISPKCERSHHTQRHAVHQTLASVATSSSVLVAAASAASSSSVVAAAARSVARNLRLRIGTALASLGVQIGLRMGAELETEVMSESDIEKFWKGVLIAVPSIRMRNFWQGGLYDVNVIEDNHILTLITSLEADDKKEVDNG
ncbi:hypothetical protein AKJ16_DCAP23824 [Drosera capensis]